MVERLCVIAVFAACGKGTQDIPAPSNRGSVDVAAATESARGDDVFEGTISGHHFSIAIPGGKLVTADRAAYTWSVGSGRLVVQDAGPVAEETRFLIARSPRTIVRHNDGVWVVTEVVTSVGGRVFTCLHQQTVARDGSPEARQVAQRGVAACSSLAVDP